MARTPRNLVIDARPRGPRGALAVERVQGQSVLDYLLDLAESVFPADRSVAIHAREEEHEALRACLSKRRAGRFVLAVGPTPADAAVLRSDRLYDPKRLRKALLRGDDPETAVIWRLDRPSGLAGADDELVRRRTYQPIGHYWALAPARWLAAALAPTRVRPNAVTLTAAGLFMSAALVTAFAIPGVLTNLYAAAALAVALILDTADGHLARLQGTASAFGRWLDSWLDEVGDMALHAAAAWSSYSQTNSVGWLLLGMAYPMGKYLFVAAAVELDDGKDAESKAIISTRSEAFAVRAVRLAGHADVRWHLWIVLTAVGRLDIALAAYAVYFPARAVMVAARKVVRHG